VGVLHDHEEEGKWRRLARHLEAWPAVGEAGMAGEVGGTGGAIGSRAGGREIFEDGGLAERFPLAGWTWKYRDFLFYIHSKLARATHVSEKLKK
jgi:hypothetical protein